MPLKKFRQYKLSIKTIDKYKEKYFLETTIYDNSRTIKQKKWKRYLINKDGTTTEYGVSRNGHYYKIKREIFKNEQKYKDRIDKIIKKKKPKSVITIKTSIVRGKWNKKSSQFQFAHAKSLIINLGKRSVVKKGKGKKTTVIQYTSGRQVLISLYAKNQEWVEKYELSNVTETNED